MLRQIRSFASPTTYLALVFMFLLSACKEQAPITVQPEGLEDYVYAYTSGMISKASDIRIRFTDAQVGDEKIGTEVESKLLSFRPNIEGRGVWTDDRTIVFSPEEMLPSGKSYYATLKLSKLFKDLSTQLQTFKFSFNTKKQNFDVDFDGLTLMDNDPGLQQYSGSVYTADAASAEEVEELLSIQYNGKTQEIDWEHSADQTTHSFVVKGLERGQSDGELEINWNGRSLDVDKKDSRSIIVPSINAFKVMDARIVQDKEQYIQVQFSDPLTKSQDIKGLVQLQDYSGKLRYNINGSELRVYPSGRINGTRTLVINQALRNTRNNRLGAESTWTLVFEERKPAVRLVGQGVVLPNSNGLTFPFEAVNLEAVDVEVFKIYNNNVLQFLQTNQLDGQSDLQRVGRIVTQRRVSLRDLNPNNEVNNWTQYAIDLSRLLEEDPNAMYQIRIGFKPSYTKYNCGNQTEESSDELTLASSPIGADGEIKSILDVNYYGIRGYYDGFRWEHRDDPCYPAYYNRDRIVVRNVFSSNLGILAKGGKNGDMLLAVTDLLTTNPLADVQLEVYDYQQQLMQTTTTDGQGMAALSLARKPFVVVARSGNQRGYLRLLDPNALSLSKFDVAGRVSQKGIKGYLYGERGVWRPGDSLYLNFVLEDKGNKLPDNHPVSFELFDPRNQSYKKITTTRNVQGVYPLTVATNADAPTGNWRANIKVGGASFSKTLKIETVKPNRLKIKMDLAGRKVLRASDQSLDIPLQVNWLHGAPARNLKARVEAKMTPITTRFSQHKEFVFDDPARVFNGENVTLLDEPVDNRGAATIPLDMGDGQNKQIPGKMRIDFRLRAFEKGGDFSEDNFSIPYLPFESYAGVSIPKNRYGSKRIDIDKGGNVDFVLVDSDGKPIANRDITVGLYRVNWRWWWERSRNNVTQYNSSTHYNALDSTRLRTNSKGQSKWNVEVRTWGRYMVRVCDQKTGHCAGDFFYAGYPWYDNDNSSQNRQAAAMLVFSSDKKKYEVGEKVELRIPTSEVGRALISIENGEKVLETYWKETKKGETRFEFYASPEMAPTVYAHVTLLQPHAQVQNDLPVRMYGVIPIQVEDPKTRLAPKLTMADVLEPKQKVKVEVSEEKGQAMAYTIAMVDEGLLDLTRFRTPNPWDDFYAREALGVKTWDMYDYVLGANGDQMNRILSIGGDGDLEGPETGKKANRFEPVVRHLGPFYLEKGQKASHEIELPNYVGSVRTMVVAANDGAYGSTEKTTPVRKPLMVLATLPRVLGPGETLKLPVNVFAMEDYVKTVSLSLEESSGLVEIAGPEQQSLRFSQPGDEIINFDLKVRDEVGIAKFMIIAKSGKEEAYQEIEIDVRNPNPYTTDILASAIEEGTIWKTPLGLNGVRGTNTITLEVANIPPLNLEKRLRYLIRYPHGCVEQTTSAVFPQLYVDNLMELDETWKREIRSNMRIAIDKLRNFQNGAGAFSYWPGSDYYSDWANNYVGHFLLAAKERGYVVPENMIDNWKTHQRSAA
ncbi:MAG: MG2 domain-containing protein, partial [Bacteroidota bacterium]